MGRCLLENGEINDIVIVGAGGFARETKWLIDRINMIKPMWNFLGFVNQYVDEENVIGNDSFVVNTKNKLAVVIGIGNPDLRQKLHMLYSRNNNVWFPNLIDPSLELSAGVVLGVGNIICANSVLTVDIKIGNFNIINLATTVGHDADIGDYNTINPGSNISGNVIIGNRVDVGTGTKIIQGKAIGDDVVIGAGAVVIDDIFPRSVVVGVPAKIIKKR